MKEAKNYYNFKNQNVVDGTVIMTGTYGRKRFLFLQFLITFSLFHTHLIKQLLWELYKRFIQI